MAHVTKPRVVNFFAGPGAGKSTLSAGLFFELKCRQMTPELALEWIKEAEYEGRNIKDGLLRRSQEYIWAKQSFRLRKFAESTQFVISDSPLLLSLVYKKDDYMPSLEKAILESYDQYENLNFFVKRSKGYVQIGRSQTREESVEKDEQIKAMLQKYGIPHIDVEYHPTTVHDYIPRIMESIGWPVKPNPFGKFSCLPSATAPEYPFVPATTGFGMKEYATFVEGSPSPLPSEDSGSAPTESSSQSE